jgi:hypothetical protein
MLLFKRAGELMPFPSYFENLLHHFLLQGKIIKIFSFNLNFLYYIYFMEGIAICALFVVGFILMIKNLTFQNFTFVLWFLLSFLLFTFIEPGIIPLRSVFICLPPLIFSVALGIEKILRKHYALFSLVSFILIIISLYKISPLLKLQSGFKEAIFHIQEYLGARKHLTTAGWASMFYMGFKDVELLKYDLSPKALKDFYKKGYKYLLVDVHKYFMKGPKERDSTQRFRWIKDWPCKKSRLLTDIEKKCRPIYIAFDNRGLYLCHWLEGGSKVLKTLNFFKDIPYEDKFGIKIYDLSDYF